MQFIDLAAQQAQLRESIDRRIARVLDDGKFIMGPEVAEFEQALSEFCGAKHSITCANGTDALVLALRALGIGAGDAVIVPAFTFAASAEAVALVGAVPVFVDVDLQTFNLSLQSTKQMVADLRTSDLKLKAILTVDLFGLPADYSAISELASSEGLRVISDAAQSFGATYRGAKVGTLGDVTTTSFFPAKPLGCYGDGGAVFCEDDELASTIKSLRVHGKGSEKYDNVRVGLNSRLDTIQAAILLEKLAIFPSEIAARNRVAGFYSNALENSVWTPTESGSDDCAWAQYTVRPKQGPRQKYISALSDAGIPTAIYYPKPLHSQTAYIGSPRVSSGLQNSELLSSEVFSIPMHPYLTEDQQTRVASAINQIAATS